MMVILLGRFRATGEIFFLASPSKSIQKEGDPAAALSFGLSATLVRLRNSDFQSSNSPRRLTQRMLKPQARHRG
jgi:hypothetical protein